MRPAPVLGMLLLALLSGCSNDAKGSNRAVPSNPSPLAHLTYDCAILDSARSAAPPGALFYFEPFDDGGSGQSRMCALDWNGKFRYQLDRGLATQQSADGSHLLLVDYPSVNGGPAAYVVTDESNHVLDRLTEIWNGQAIWADDSRRLCYLADSDPLGQSGQAYLYDRVPGQVARRVSSIGVISYFPPVPSRNGGGVPSPFVAGPQLLACSVGADRVVLLNPATGAVSTRRLSDGVVLQTHLFGHSFYPFPNPVGAERLIASRDGRYIADDVDGSTVVPILDLLVDGPARSLPVRQVTGFSWDDTLAVTQLDDQVVQIMDWRTGRVVRQLAGSYPYAFARPASADVLVGLPSTRHQFGLDLYIVRADGSAFEVARSVEVIGR